MRPAALLSVLVLCLGGCSPHRGDGGGDEGTPDLGSPGNPGKDPPGVLTVTPAVTSLTVNGVDQTVTLHALSKRYGDVSSRATWTLSDGNIGFVNGGKLTVRGTLDRGGAYKVTAFYRNETGSATLNLRANLPDVIDPSAPPDAPTYFGGPMGGAAPQLLYPFDNTMMAPNVLQVELQWRPGAGDQRVFRISAEGPTYTRTFYVGCSGQCRYLVDDKVWSGLGHSSLGQDVALTIAGVARKDAPVGVSTPATLHFSPEDIRGGLYYFSPTIRGIKRVPLGASRPVDFITNGAETGCAGCHSVSRDGKLVAVEFGSGQTRVGSTVVDGAMPAKRNFALNPSISWNFSWFNPTGDRIVTNWSSVLTIRDVATGQVTATVPQAMYGNGAVGGAMPEWSPDGKWLAFVRVQNAGFPNYDFELQNSGDICVMPYNDGAFGPAVELVHGQPNSEVHFWPSWSPDSKWLVFDSQTCGGGQCMQYNAVQTRLRLVRAIDDAGNVAAGQQPIELVNGTHQKFQTNNWPKFAPFLQAGRYVFVVYSARYPWGLNSSGEPQLFMFGLDMDKAKAGDDPSYQPIWLPFQERSTGNHSAIWTTDVACVEDKDCPSEFVCTAGMCVPRIG